MHIVSLGDSIAVQGASLLELEHIPGIKIMSNGYARGSHDALAVLLDRGNVPHGLKPPKVDITNWEGPEYLRRYQLEGVAWLMERLGEDGGALLADDMGLGKTLETISAWQALGEPPVLVVCPASVRLGWVKQFQRWAGREAYVVSTAKKWAGAKSAKIIITSYELAGQIGSIYPQMVIIDEVHHLRGRGAKRSRGILEVAQTAQYRLGLSGTPLWSRPRDLWMVLRILFPRYRFGTAEEFDYAYCGAFINAYGGRVAKGLTRSEELQARLRWVCLRRLKEDVLDELPAITRTVRYVQPTPIAKRALDGWASQQLSLAEALTATLEAKIPEVVEVAKEAASPILVFTWQKAHAREIARQLVAADIPAVLLTGDLSLKERNALVERAAREKVSVVATIDAAGQGVDGLQHVATQGVFHALDWVPLKLLQAEARLHRLGQKGAVQWTYLVMRGSADALVEEAVLEKLDQWARTMGGDAASGGVSALLGGEALSKENEAELLQDMMQAFAHLKEETKS